MKSFLAPFLSSFVILVSSLAAKQPNVVIIFIDDMGYADIGPYGATKQKTPNLDRMAQEGMKLTSFYAASVCSVSRAQLMTGCYGARISVPGVYGPGSRNGLHPQENTIADLLKAQGYATQCVGKWHLGDQPEFLPTKQGFDHYLGIPYSNDMLKTDKDSGKRVVPLLRDEKVVELLTEEDQSRIEERYTEEAVGFIRANKEKPFFLYFPHTAVHTPIWPGEAFRGKSQNGRFGDWVEEVDWSVGRVLDTLRELKLDENTLVLFTSDNGPWLIKGADGGSALPLRGGKGSTWEGGVRVPTVAWWPGKIAPASVCDAVAGTIDMLPTCVSLAGGKVPAEPVIDGRDISALLFGKTSESQREAHYYFAGYNLQAVRQGPWKLAISTQPETMGKGPAEDAKINPRLYNLDTEINEHTNLADKHPDIVAKLSALADKMGAELGGKEPKSRRPAGEVENPVTLYPTSDAPRRNAKQSSPLAPREEPGAPQTPQTYDVSAMLRSAPNAHLAEQDGHFAAATLAPDKAPHIANTPFTLTCEVITAQRDAVLIAHGGASVGYALHLSGGKAVWSLRHGKSLTNAETAFPSDNQHHRIAATLGKDGTMTVQVDDQPPATAKGPGLIRNEPKEDFCVGHDNKIPVGNYTGKRKFEGSIANVKVLTK